MIYYDILQLALDAAEIKLNQSINDHDCIQIKDKNGQNDHKASEINMTQINQQSIQIVGENDPSTDIPGSPSAIFNARETKRLDEIQWAEKERARTTKFFAVSGDKDPAWAKLVSNFRKVCIRLAILSLVNIICSTIIVVLFGAILGLGYSGICLELIISNICLWLGMTFNENKFRFCCKPILKVAAGCDQRYAYD